MRTQYLTAVDLRERYHCSRMWLHRRIVKSDFPKGVHLGGSKELRWRLDVVEQWETNADNHPKPVVNVGAALSPSADNATNVSTAPS